MTKKKLLKVYKKDGERGMFQCTGHQRTIISLKGCYSRCNFSLSKANVSKVAFDEVCRECKTGRIVAEILNKELKKIVVRTEARCAKCRQSFPIEKMTVMAYGIKKTKKPYCAKCERELTEERKVLNY